MAMDTYWDNTVLAMHMDGPNEGAAFVDLKGHTVTAISGAKFSTAQSKFGGASALFNGTTDYLTVLDSEDFELTSTHTIEMWVRFTALPVASKNCVLVSKWNGTADKRSWMVALYNTGGVYTLRAYYSNNGATSVAYQFTVTPAINTWYSYAITNDGSYVRAFVNGAQPSAGQSYTVGPLFNSDEPIGVGIQNITSTPSGFVAGYIDDLRITKGVARYTAGYTAATAAFDDGLPPYAALTAPMPTLEFYGGGSVAVSPPAPTLVSVGGSAALLTAPSPAIYATAHISTKGASLTAPAPTLEAWGGANAKLTAPTPTLSSTATGVILGTAALSAPSPNVSASGRTSAMANMALTVPGPNVKAYGGAVVSVTIGAPTVASTGTTGAVGRAALTVPMFQLSASGSEQNHGSANLVVPMPRMAASIQAYMTAPMATLTAIGTATITATYEAYALNLKHSDPEANDELTRYTNFPFTHVVRYKDSYYGVSAGALYLLEGTTDNTVPIPFDVKTATTDFDAPELKTVRYAYFGGRMGSASTVSITAGETTPVSYSYTTPRGTLAQNYRQPFGRGLKARYFSFGVSGSEELQIDTIDLDVLTLKRRI